MRYTVAALYHFVQIENVKELQAELLELGHSTEMCGTLLLAEEGINGTIAGPDESVRALCQRLLDDERFSGMSLKYSWSDVLPFYRWKVRIKKEIVTIKLDVDPTQTVGEYVDPERWNEIISDPDVILIDTRNSFEFKLGTFRGAVDPETVSFGEFPQWLKERGLLQSEQKVAMFCTGGIRCEKATSYLLDQGTPNVYHLKGGILKYLEQIPEETSLWDGQCFVFDRRISVGHGLEPGSLHMCFGCRDPLTEEEMAHEDYEEGVCCPKCVNVLTEERKARFRERQHQLALSRERGEKHFFGKADHSTHA